MADVDIAPHFGLELKVSCSFRAVYNISRVGRLTVFLSVQDGFKTVNAWAGNGINWLEDIQQFYRERSTIEKEYSAKLAALAKKYYEKKTKKSSGLSVGDTPTMTPGSLER
jgi:hypothetical protein